MQLESESRGSNVFDDNGSSFGDKRIRAAYHEVLRACGRSGLDAADSADVAQDLFLWLLLHPEKLSLLSPASLGSVIDNYVMRLRRRKWLQGRREALSLDVMALGGTCTFPACDEITMSVDKLGRLLPVSEGAVLTALRRGETWAEATSGAGIPAGSRAWLRKRMAEHVRAAFRPHRSRGSGRGGIGRRI